MNDIMLSREILSRCEARVSPDDVTVRVVDLPPFMHGFVRPDPEGHYNVYINARDPRWRQYRALEHEIEHIASGDVWSDASISELENL